MKIGVYMFTTDYAIRVDDLARALEARGFESMWVPEHTHIPASRRTPFPGGGELPKHYSHTLDPFVALAAAAMVTTELVLGTGICLIIERDAIVTAKEVASLDLLSNGRLLFGIGGGWNAEEMENHGTEFKTRFERMREQVAAMKAIWTEDEAAFHGEHVSFDPIWSWPKPVQTPHPPIYVGGNGRHARQRVAEYGDGWLPIGLDREQIIRGIDDVKERMEEQGRDPSTLTVTVYGARPGDIDAYAEAGVERCVLSLPALPSSEALAKLDEWAPLLG